MFFPFGFPLKPLNEGVPLKTHAPKWRRTSSVLFRSVELMSKMRGTFGPLSAADRPAEFSG